MSFIARACEKSGSTFEEHDVIVAKIVKCGAHVCVCQHNTTSVNSHKNCQIWAGADVVNKFWQIIAKLLNA